MPIGIYIRTEEHKKHISEALRRYGRLHNKPYIHTYKRGNKIYRRVEIHRDGRKIKYSRLIIENKLGRKLKPNEVVHHKNRNTLDDRINNLQVMSLNEHSRLHSAGKNNAMYGKTGELNSRWSRSKVNCLICGKKVYKQAYSMKLYKKHFCSNKCARKYNNKITVQCPLCKKITLKFPSEVKRNRRFCSLLCAYNYKKLNPNLYYTDISNRPRNKYGRLMKYKIAIPRLEANRQLF